MSKTQAATQEREDFAGAWTEANKDASVKVASGPLGTGAAQQAADKINSRAYKLHVEEAKAMGEKPMTQEEFDKQSKPTKT